MTTLVSMYMTGDIFIMNNGMTVFYGIGQLIFLQLWMLNFVVYLGEYKSYEHPFVYTRLGELFDHLKGPDRKEQGYSSERFDNKIATAAQ